MVKEPLGRVYSIVAEMVSLDQDQRTARLEELCGDSPHLQAAVAKLLVLAERATALFLCSQRSAVTDSTCSSTSLI